MSYLLRSSSLEAEPDTRILVSVMYGAGAMGSLWVQKVGKGRENEALWNPLPQHMSATEVAPPSGKETSLLCSVSTSLWLSPSLGRLPFREEAQL